MLESYEMAPNVLQVSPNNAQTSCRIKGNGNNNKSEKLVKFMKAKLECGKGYEEI